MSPLLQVSTSLRTTRVTLRAWFQSERPGVVPERTAVRVIHLTGVGPFVQKLRDMRFSHLESEDYYGPSVALGSADVSLYELVNAYRTLASGGVWSEMRLTPEKDKAKGRRVFSRETAFLVSDILSDREARSTTFGLENPLPRASGHR